LSSILPLGAPAQIEAILLEHPEIERVSIHEQDGPTGDHYPIVYATASAEPHRPAGNEISSTEREKRIGQWRSIFNLTYRAERADRSPNFVGWRSSYTNGDIPTGEMQEWLDCTIERIQSFAPERVLEIGCGVGLLTERLASRCQTYRATDLSGMAIGRLREFVAARPDLRHVELSEREATNFEGFAPESFDMAVLNSVVQYFPDLDYLETVLKHAAEVVASGGRIFVGDIRHLGLLPVFHSSVQLAKAPSAAKISWLRSKVALMVDQERELVIDPSFFLALSSFIPRIRQVDILLKRGRASNEISRYRYDVVLHIGDRPTDRRSETICWRADELGIDEIVSNFEAQELAAVRILGVPNLRISRDIAASQLLDSGDDQELVADVREKLERIETSGIDPEAFWRLSDRGAYDVMVECPPRSGDGRFDVTISRRGTTFDHRPRLGYRTELPGARSPPKATNPLAAAYRQQLGMNLSKVLRERLPELRQPLAVLVVEQMPDVSQRHVA
jgi:SAM-dependent methyltransferase